MNNYIIMWMVQEFLELVALEIWKKRNVLFTCEKNRRFGTKDKRKGINILAK